MSAAVAVVPRGIMLSPESGAGQEGKGSQRNISFIMSSSVESLSVGSLGELSGERLKSQQLLLRCNCIASQLL